MRPAILLAAAYAAAIIYASLEPFEGWRMPTDPLFGFLTAPWPRYTIISDIVLNIAAYFPFSALLYLVLRPALSPRRATVAAILLSGMLSFTLESIQMLLPTRIASNVDLATNIAGAAGGACAARTWWPSLSASVRCRLRDGLAGDAGIVVVALWILVQLYPVPLAFGSGDLREALNLAPAFAHTAAAYAAAQATVVALFTGAAGLLVSLALQPQRAPLPAAAVALLLALAVKSLATGTLTGAGWTQWITPGVVIGLAASALALPWVVRQSLHTRATLAIACLAAGVIAVNIAPQNPYQTTPVFMLPPEITHLARFGHIMLALSVCWPLLAVAYCGWMIAAAARSGHRL